MDNKQIVVVDSIGEKDDYGNLPFKGKDGQDYKVGSKRENLFSQIIEGRAVELIWSEYKGKRYISDAHLVEAGEPRPVPQDNVPPEHKVTGVKPDTVAKSDGKNRSYALSYAKDWAIALLDSSSFTKKETLTARSIIQTAKVFEEYLDTGKAPESKLEQEAIKLGAEVAP